MLDDLRNKYRTKRDVKCWERLGKPVPPPSFIKQQTVLFYARQCNIDTFVETGTYLGEMVNAVKNVFNRIYSIELGEELYEKAQKKFENDSHIKILKGDSGETLQTVLKQIEQPALFWLDAHYSAGDTAKAELETPILKELESILCHSVRNHVILIDDARLFNGLNDYPSIRELVDFISRRKNDAKMEIINDIIRIY